jgi:hypothetical protein
MAAVTVSATGVSGTGETNGVLVWGLIIPDQDPSYSQISPSQSPSWSSETPSQTPDWIKIAV